MDWPSKSAGFDNFQKLYNNQEQIETKAAVGTKGADGYVAPEYDMVEVKWNGHTSQTNLKNQPS